MLNQDHPDDERLSALASRDADATADAALTAHVPSCARCTELVAELGSLSAALADLPDLRPSRPLQLLPPVVGPASGVDRLGGWARRFFAPVLASGAALALVGVIGTAAPALDSMASGQAGGADTDGGVMRELAVPGASAAAEQPTRATAGDSLHGGAAGEESAASPLVAELSSPGVGDEGGSSSAGNDLNAVQQEPDAGRSPWPMVLFAGVALMIAAAVSRWILVPRSGT